MACSPLVKPPAPELRAHLRSVGTQFAEAFELLVDVGACAEVHRPHKVVEAVLGEVARPVALEENRTNLVALLVLGVPISLEQIADGTDVRFVLAIAAILVLYLHHDDRSTMLYGQRGELLSDFLLEDLHTLHEKRILLAQTDVLLLQQPPGQSTHFPLGADVWSRSHDDVHTIFLCQSAEGGHVVVAREVEMILLWLMDVPKHVEAECVHAEGFAHFDALLPIGSGYAWIVHLSGFDDKRLAVEEEGAFSHREITTAVRCQTGAWAQHHGQCEHKKKNLLL